MSTLYFWHMYAILTNSEYKDIGSTVFRVVLVFVSLQSSMTTADCFYDYLMI